MRLQGEASGQSSTYSGHYKDSPETHGPGMYPVLGLPVVRTDQTLFFAMSHTRRPRPLGWRPQPDTREALRELASSMETPEW